MRTVSNFVSPEIPFSIEEQSVYDAGVGKISIDIMTDIMTDIMADIMADIMTDLDFQS